MSHKPAKDRSAAGKDFDVAQQMRETRGFLMGFYRLRGSSKIKESYFLVMSTCNRTVISIGILLIALMLLSSCAHYHINSRVESFNLILDRVGDYIS